MESKRYLQRLLCGSSTCRVCGDAARGYNFQVLTCMSCKSFFRRNALSPWGTLKCREKNNCIITQKKRLQCAACRLKKCFLLGMNPKLIRRMNQCNLLSINFQQSIIINQNKTSLPSVQTLVSIRDDSSNLTFQQWGLLSNIIHVYDELNPFLKIKYLFKQQTSLPPKFRFKPLDTLNLIGSFIRSIQSTIESSPYFQALSIIARRTLIKNNFEGVGSIHGFFGIHEINAINDPVFKATCHELYGPVYLTRILSVCKRLDSNLLFVKIIIFVLIFSTSFSIVTFKKEENVRIMLNSIELVKIQDIYVNVLWKYMIYQYGFNKAVRCFDSLMKSVLDILHIMENLANIKEHNQMINTVVKEMEYSLTI